MPEIAKLENGDYLIIGKIPDQATLAELASIGKFPGSGEIAIVIDAHLLAIDFWHRLADERLVEITKLRAELKLAEQVRDDALIEAARLY